MSAADRPPGCARGCLYQRDCKKTRAKRVIKNFRKGAALQGSKGKTLLLKRVSPFGTDSYGRSPAVDQQFTMSFFTAPMVPTAMAKPNGDK